MPHPKSRAPADAKTKALSRRDTLKLASAVGALGVGLGAVEDVHAETVRVKLTRASLGKIRLRLYRQASSSAGGVELLESLDLSSLTRGQAKGRYSLKLYNVRSDREQLLSEQELEIAESTPSK